MQVEQFSGDLCLAPCNSLCNMLYAYRGQHSVWSPVPSFFFDGKGRFTLYIYLLSFCWSAYLAPSLKLYINWPRFSNAYVLTATYSNQERRSLWASFMSRNSKYALKFDFGFFFYQCVTQNLDVLKDYIYINIYICIPIANK